MTEIEFRRILREMLFDAARHQQGSRAGQEQGWMEQHTAEAIERLANSWVFGKGLRSRDQLLEDVRNELSKTDNSLLRAIDPEWLADSLMRLEDSK